MTKFPKIDFKELDEEISLNIKQRREFVKQYAAWLKKTPNKKWSKQQNKMLQK